MEIKRFLSEILKNINLKRIKWKEIAVTAAVAALAGVIIIPSVAKCVDNDKKSKCGSRMYVLADRLSAHMSGEGPDGEWHNMVLGGKSVEALEILAAEAKADEGWIINPEDFYIERRDNIIYVRSKEYPEITDKKFPIEALPSAEKQVGGFGWNANADRQIEDVTTLGGRSFIVDAGADGRYCVSAWDWQDYVRDAAAEDGKTYGASVVYYDGVYYYYPDGFRVQNYSENTNPFSYAVDTENEYRTAYCITVDVSATVSGRFSVDSREGSLMVENGSVYIRQTRPSKKAGKGWIQIECETKKL